MGKPEYPQVIVSGVIQLGASEKGRVPMDIRGERVSIRAAQFTDINNASPNPGQAIQTALLIKALQAAPYIVEITEFEDDYVLFVKSPLGTTLVLSRATDDNLAETDGRSRVERDARNQGVHLEEDDIDVRLVKAVPRTRT